LLTRRITVFVGSFGSGKTEIAVNLALSLASSGERAVLADLDFVKPYFRSRSAREFMEAAGVHLVVPHGEHYHADLPILLPEVRTRAADGTSKLLLDVGGDDTGARVLGALSDVLSPAEADVYFVVNFRRPFTETPEQALKMVRDIEAVARLRATGVVSNTHLMSETTPALVREGHALARETARLAGVPLVAVGVEETLRAALDEAELGCPVWTLRRIIRPPFEEPPRPRRTGPVFVLG
jgi:Mrp family chromosome partitioning ATPase